MCGHRIVQADSVGEKRAVRNILLCQANEIWYLWMQQWFTASKRDGVQTTQAAEGFEVMLQAFQIMKP
jgi:hypothetical protein